jgi:mannitol-1-phosphate/altronate dehydrogenase
MKPRAVIIGAGALGLGFVAERLAPDYDLCLADLGSQEARLRWLERQQSYTVNLCSLAGVTSKQVQGSMAIAFTDRPAEDVILRRAVEQADLILTVTSRRLPPNPCAVTEGASGGRPAGDALACETRAPGQLDQIVPWLSEMLNARETRHYLLFCENGLHIARSFANRFGRHTVLVDTVMSRMCRFDALGGEAGYTQGGAPYHPLWPGHEEALVVEDYEFWPLDAGICEGGPFSQAFSLVPPEEFLLWEDIKLYMHNGMHAFVAYQAFLEGARSFAEVPNTLREAARETMLAEVVPAILRTHACARPAELEEYGLALLARFFNPYFADSIERGIRGVKDKLAPDERLLGGCEYIRRAGISPVGYARTIAAAQAILARQAVL